MPDLASAILFECVVLSMKLRQHCRISDERAVRMPEWSALLWTCTVSLSRGMKLCTWRTLDAVICSPSAHHPLLSSAFFVFNSEDDHRKMMCINCTSKQKEFILFILILLIIVIAKRKSKKTPLLWLLWEGRGRVGGRVPFGHNAMCRALGHAGRKQISTLALSNGEACSSASGPAVI